MHQIGVGVLGPVFRTYEPSEDRLVAVKAFHLDVTPEQTQTLLEAFERLVASGLDHPGIVASLAVGLEDDVLYLAQEYVAAESLDVAIRHYSPASIETAMPFIRQISAALDAAHEQGIPHGALHLRDIFVSPEEARVTGFGIVKALEEIGLAGPIRRPYSAPEVISGFGWGGAADRFALAAIAYELLTGRRAAGTGDQVTERIRSIEGVADPEHLEEVFAIALADDPDDRYSSAARFVSALEFGVGDDLGGPAESAPESEPERGTAPLDLLAGLELRRDEPDADPTLDPVDQLESARARDEGEEADREDVALEVQEEAGGLGDLGEFSQVDELEPVDPVGAAQPDDTETDDIVVEHGDSRVSELPEFQPAARVDKFALHYAEDDQNADNEDDEDEGREDAGTDLDAVAEHEDLPVGPVTDVQARDALDQDSSNKDSAAFDALDLADGQEDEADGAKDQASSDLDALYAAEDGYAASRGIDGTSDTSDPDDTAQTDYAYDGDDDSALEGIPVLPPAEQEPPSQRSGWGRVVGPVLAIALVVGGIAYFVGLALAPDDGPTDQVLDSQSAVSDPAVPANRVSEGAVGAGVGASPAGNSSDDDTESTPAEPVIADTGAEPGSISDTPRVESAAPETPGASSNPVGQEPVATGTRTVRLPVADVPAASVDAAPPPVSASVPAGSQPTGWLLVRTDPPGATVTLNGVARGQTPLSLRDISFGTHSLEVSRAGFETVEREVTVSERENVVPVGVELAPADGSSTPGLSTPAPGSLAVQSRPSGARVTVDGRSAGVTPLVVSLPIGRYQVRIEGDGYQSWVTNVEVTSDERAQVNASLERLTR